MFNTRLTTPLVLVLVFISTITFSQVDEIGTEVVNIVKPYSPTISDAFKVKETPILYDSINTTKKEVQYGIFSVPVASTFTPAKGKAANVEKTKKIKLYDNYATLGFGNYTSILGEFFSNFQISRTDNFGLFFKHNSSQGGIDDIKLENKYYVTKLVGNYTSRQKDATYLLKVGVKHQLFNWYGLNGFFDEVSEEDLPDIDAQQTYTSGNLGGSISLEDSFFEKGTLNLHYLSDAFSSSEINVTANPEISIPLTDFTLIVDGELDYLNGNFERNYMNTSSINYSFLNAGIGPSLVYVNEDLTISLGVQGMVSIDLENSETEFFIYPRVNISYRLLDEQVIAYGGTEGGLEQNTYYNFKEENPFVSPTLNVMPTSQLFNGFAGLKGKLSNSFGYNIRASYGKSENQALFIVNTFKGTGEQSEGYEYGNSFNVIYDDINTLSVFGELKIEPSENFSLGINGTFYNFDTSNETEAWNLPELKATVFSNFNFSEKVYGGVSIFYVGERKDMFTVLGGIFNLPFSEIVTLDDYIDANVHLGYIVNDQLSFFIKGSNLLSDSYEKWYNYPVQSIQGLLGATYKFDW